VKPTKWSGSEYVWDPHSQNRDVILQYIQNTAKHRGHYSHTFVCVKCSIKYLHNKGDFHGKERKEVDVFFRSVPSTETGLGKVKCRMREFTVRRRHRRTGGPEEDRMYERGRGR
jgi:hypothetical protein